jgi:hypothetical protein
MTFSTPKPFFPYREPESTQGPVPTRLLRVFFLSTAKVKGTLGEKVKVTPWPGSTAWAGKITAADRERILDQIKLPSDMGPESWWLTEFEDYSSPRPGHADLYFNPSGDDVPVERPPHIQYVANSFPDSVICYALVGYLAVPCLVRRWRRRKGG